MSGASDWQGGLFGLAEDKGADKGRAEAEAGPVAEGAEAAFSSPAAGEKPPGSGRSGRESAGDFKEPLSARMRPRSLEEYVGQGHLVGPGKMLRRLLEADSVPSLILWGPPGTGKTTLAQIISAHTKASFVPVSAVMSGVADIRREIAEAKKRWSLLRRRTLLFIDEIHRFNKAQQDCLLPHVEDGTVILIGATTENPSFQVVSPLLSRCRVLVLEALSTEDIMLLLRRALEDRERGLGEEEIEADEGVLRSLAEVSGGDARCALNTLEEAAEGARPDRDGRKVLSAELVAEALQRPRLRHDRSGESHYNIISAMIKSIRGSDPDAAVYWLSRLLESGEDPMFVARRLVILASEDVGLADPQALNVAVSAQQAAHFVGMPEGFYPLAEAALYLALAPKSNSVGEAYRAALRAAERYPGAAVPLHLRNAPTKLMKECGYAGGYKYAHDYPDHYVRQQFLPDELEGSSFYKGGNLGYEKKLAAWLRYLREERH